jgi:two-component system phosphate regulon sensor histidine kinase PhoR
MAVGRSIAGVRPWRLTLSAAQILLPATAALLGLGLLGHLRPLPALAAWLLAVLISGLLAWVRERRLNRTRQYLAELVEAREPPPPPGFGPLIDDGLDRAFRQLRTALSEGRRRVVALDQVLNALLDVMPDPILVVDEERRVVRANRAALHEFGQMAVDKPLEATLRDPGLLGAVDGILSRRREPAIDQDTQLALHLPGGVARAFAARVVPVRLSGQAAVLIGLREQTDQLMIERMRSDFIANASHEIRTPLAALLGFIETLQGPARADPEARERFLETMAAEARRMSRLVEDLLSLSRIELIAHQPPDGEVDLADCALTVVRNLEPYARDREVALDVRIEPMLSPVPGDRDQLIQLLTNLIDNAIKYGGAGTTVTVAVDRLATAPPAAGPLTGRPAARIMIRDQGPGIAREHLPRLTERFFRADPARSRAAGGTGLGLAIVKHILRRHRGHLAIESEPGQGSTFIVHLPLG